MSTSSALDSLFWRARGPQLYFCKRRAQRLETHSTSHKKGKQKRKNIPTPYQLYQTLSNNQTENSQNPKTTPTGGQWRHPRPGSRLLVASIWPVPKWMESATFGSSVVPEVRTDQPSLRELGSLNMASHYRLCATVTWESACNRPYETSLWPHPDKHCWKFCQV